MDRLASRLAFALFLTLLALGAGAPISQAQELISVTLPRIAVKPSQGQVVIPVTVGDLTDREVRGFQFTILYDPQVILMTDTDISGTLSSGTFLIDNTTEPGVIKVAMANSTPISGSGVLVNIEADVIAEGLSDLTFTEFKFNSGDPPAVLLNGSAGVYSNLPPQAAPLNAVINEDTPITFTVVASDPEGDPIFFDIGTLPDHGTLGTLNVLNASSASVEYTPAENFSGYDSFNFAVSDNDNAALVTVSIQVVAVDDAPSVQADTYEVIEEGSLTVDAEAGVLANDFDVEGNALTAALVETTPNGTLNFNADGSFSYEPAVDFYGPDTFVYSASDGLLTSQATVTINVIGVNESPIASEITSPTDGVQLVLGGPTGQSPIDGSDTFAAVTWSDAQDPDNDVLNFHYEIAGDADFNNVVFSTDVTTLGYDLTVAEAAEAFGQLEDAVPGAIVTVYHRVTVSDSEFTLVGGSASMVWERGRITGTESEDGLPESFTLHGNYPNPFNPVTTIHFDLPETAQVSVIVLDMLGRRVVGIPAQIMSAGANHSIQVDAASLASGIYVYRVEARMAQETAVQTGVMTLLK